MSPVEKQIRELITQNGPINIETFMDMAISHYYATRDPFGVAGDFITAPEISQMFGEIIGIWVADAWIKLGKPEAFQLIEGGPGRGTLMADVLRATKKIPGFHDAVQIHLIETSPVLREAQKQTLADYSVTWHNNLDNLSADPVIFIANELFDAFPIRQFECTGEIWHERYVDVQDDKLVISLQPVEMHLPLVDGAIKEVSPVSLQFLKNLTNLIMANKGVALIIDYGYDDVRVGDTLQAVKGHQYAPVLEDVGNADLTAHVDFLALKVYAPASSPLGPVTVSGPVNQGDFLRNMGINMRLERLKSIATPEQTMDLQTGYVRLTAPNQMGTLFKVMGLCHDPSIQLGGFHD